MNSRAKVTPKPVMKRKADTPSGLRHQFINITKHLPDFESLNNSIQNLDETHSIPDVRILQDNINIEIPRVTAPPSTSMAGRSRKPQNINSMRKTNIKFPWGYKKVGDTKL
jgi:hypothetical protein